MLAVEYSGWLLFILNLPGTKSSASEFIHQWLPMITTEHVVWAVVALNLLMAVYFFSQDRLLHIILNKVTLQNPDRVKMLPEYERIRAKYSPDGSSLGFQECLRQGMEEFEGLVDRADKGDMEARFIASELSRQLRIVARNAYGSGIDAIKYNSRLDEGLKRLDRVKLP